MSLLGDLKHAADSVAHGTEKAADSVAHGVDETPVGDEIHKQARTTRNMAQARSGAGEDGADGDAADGGAEGVGGDVAELAPDMIGDDI